MTAESKKRWEQANRERMNEYRKQWRRENADKVNAQTRARYHNRKEVDPERHYIVERIRKYKANYGVSIEWYEETLAKQGGTCAYPPCGRTVEPSGRKLAVDHDHETGKPRSIMCYLHNTRTLDLEWHKWAIAYIEAHKGVEHE